MKLAQKGDRVRINYVGTLEDGTIIDTTFGHEHDDDDCGCGDDCGCEDETSDDCGCDDDCGCGDEAGPAELVIGADAFLPMIEDALIGMKPGEKKTVVIPTDDAFGEYDAERVFTVERSQLPEGFHPEAGMGIELDDEDGDTFEVLIAEVTDTTVTLDANHPLAGEDITYEVELLEIL